MLLNSDGLQYVLYCISACEASLGCGFGLSCTWRSEYVCEGHGLQGRQCGGQRQRATPLEQSFERRICRRLAPGPRQGLKITAARQVTLQKHISQCTASRASLTVVYISSGGGLVKWRTAFETSQQHLAIVHTGRQNKQTVSVFLAFSSLNIESCCTSLLEIKIRP